MERRSAIFISSGNRPFERSPWFKFALAGLSLANLWYFRIWSALLTYTRADEFLMQHTPPREHYLAAMTNVVLMGALLAALLFWISQRWHRRRPGVPEWLLFLCLLVPLNGLRAVLASHFDWLGGQLIRLIGTGGLGRLAFSILMVVTIAYYFLYRPIIRLLFGLLLILAPAIAVTFVQSVWRMAHHREIPGNQPLATPFPAVPGSPRVVWLTFDELDYRLALEARPSGVRMPEFDRLHAESVFATHAVAPSTATMHSIISQATGRLVAEVVFVDFERALVRFGPRKPEVIGHFPTVFSTLREAGVNIGIVGWYLPYGRVFNESVTRCVWTPLENQTDTGGSNFAEMAMNQTRSLVETSLLSPFGPSLSVLARRRNLRTLSPAVQDMVRDPSLRLVFLHLPVPHAPHVFDARTRSLTLTNSPVGGYRSALEHADTVLGDVLRTIETSETAATTTLLVTSDHHYRSKKLFGEDSKDFRVPFLVKFPGKGQALTYNRPFNTVVNGELVLDVIDGKVRDSEAAREWLDARAKQ